MRLIRQHDGKDHYDADAGELHRLGIGDAAPDGDASWHYIGPKTDSEACDPQRKERYGEDKGARLNCAPQAPPDCYNDESRDHQHRAKDDDAWPSAPARGDHRLR